MTYDMHYTLHSALRSQAKCPQCDYVKPMDGPDRIVAALDRLTAALLATASPSSSPVDAPAASSEQRGCPETVWDGPYSFVCNKGVTTGVCHQHGRFRDAPSRPTGTPGPPDTCATKETT